MNINAPTWPYNFNTTRQALLFGIVTGIATFFIFAVMMRDSGGFSDNPIMNKATHYAIGFILAVAFGSKAFQFKGPIKGTLTRDSITVKAVGVPGTKDARILEGTLPLSAEHAFFTIGKTFTGKRSVTLCLPPYSPSIPTAALYTIAYLPAGAASELATLITTHTGLNLVTTD